jgi:hypothetical protein
MIAAPRGGQEGLRPGNSRSATWAHSAGAEIIFSAGADIILPRLTLLCPRLHWNHRAAAVLGRTMYPILFTVVTIALIGALYAELNDIFRGNRKSR